MPKYEDYSDEQEWDVISWNKTPQDKQQQNEKYIETLPFNKK